MANKIIFVILCGLVIAGCNSKPENKNAEIEPQQETASIELTGEQFKTVGIELGKIEQKNLHSIVKASGYLEVPPQNKASVSTFIGAVIKSISVVEGVFVKQ